MKIPAKLLQLCLSAAVLLTLAAGCQHDVTIKKVGADGREDYENALVLADGLSADTVNFLGNHLLRSRTGEFPEQFIIELEKIYNENPSPKACIAIAEIARLSAEKHRDDADLAIRYELTALIYTHKYLAYGINNRSGLLFDPEVIVAVKCYNLALTNLFSYLKERKLHETGTYELTAAGGQKIHFQLPDCQLPVKKEHIVDYIICADYRPVRLTHNGRTFGVGVPLICELEEDSVPGTIFAEGQVIPATLACKIDFTKEENRCNARLFYLDSRSVDDVTVNDLKIPIAQDFSTPLAYMVKEPPPFDFIQRTFQIELTSRYEGLYHLEPHNDNRIPIVLVHGLLSDIRTWLQLINTLQSDPELRKNYRFMGFSYSSGNPIFISAMQLRESLLAERERLRLAGHDLTKFDQMILIGHSMGGLLARLMVTTSSDEILSDFVKMDFYPGSNPLQDPDFRKVMIFQPVPSVKRVIFIAVPHRGSELAQTWYGQLAASMVKVPSSLIDLNVNLLKHLNIISTDKQDEIISKFNGIDNLSPSGLALQLLNFLPISPDVPYHSIIGNNGKGGIPGGSDGVVSYSSSHLENAVSEVVVKSDHSVQQNPLAIREIKRILKLHIKSVKK